MDKKALAIELRKSGARVSDIAKELRCDKAALSNWLAGIPRGEKAKTKGSGVIAPAPYALGYRFFNTRL